ncbi:MAG TPA: energy transducer TonB [Gammaproteobacteria bacterium]|nr:energy transducer TonB [Gammaproteobacteria bacterium]
MKTLFTSLLLAAALSITPGCASTKPKPAEKFRLQDQEIDKTSCRPINRVVPEYPRDAKDQGIEGYAVVEFLLNSQGRPKDVRVVESMPPDVFSKAAKAAVSHNKYTPCLVAREPVDTYGAREKIIFDLKQGPHYFGGDRLPFITP